jgi:D-psicose/D-tagatose/L-ribulose 3-epimerase
VPFVRGEPNEFRRLRQLLDAAGLERVASTVMPPGRSPAAASEREQKAALDHIGWALRNTHELGATMLVGPLHQTLGVFSGNSATASELARLTAFHRRAGDLAASLGLTIAVEPMNRYEGHIFNRTDDLAKYLRDLDHPAIVAAFDTFHANIEDDDLVATLARNVASIGYVQVSSNHRGMLGTGHLPWHQIFSTLKRGGYDSWLTVHVPSRAVSSFAAGARVWRGPVEGRSEVCERSHAFVRQGWDAA